MSMSAMEPVTGASPTAGLSGMVSPTTQGPSKDKEMFLQLMVAQLRYQDPMNPADSGEFLAQSAQFNALEKMQEVADQTSLVLGAQMAFGASGFVGRQVTYTLPDGTQGAGMVRGASFSADGPVLDVNGTQVPLVSVLSVNDGSAPAVPPAPAAATPVSTPVASPVTTA